jgi:fatty-acyl-CoA synthase
MTAAYTQNLDKTAANFQPLTPLGFLARAAQVFPDYPAIVHGAQTHTYAEFYERAKRLASALARLGIGKNDTVSVMLPNVPSMLEAKFGVPMAGAVLHSMNTRLDAANIAFMIDHAETKLIVTDTEYASVIGEALKLTRRRPIMVDYADPIFPNFGGRVGEVDYEGFLDTGDPAYEWKMPDDEWDAITLNYTSGTTGDPKGVVYHHRGAYLLSLGNTLAANMGKHPRYLWTLPMFHCDGWCFPWTLPIVAGVQVCLRYVRADAIWNALADHKITHLCGAPIVMSTLLNAPPEVKRPLAQPVEFLTAAAPPPETVLAEMRAAGFNVTHVYGLTEVYGPAVVNEWKAEWNVLDSAAQAQKKARQGVRYVPLEDLAVLVPETMEQVPADGETLGEVMFRGNVVMKGYLKNKAGTDAALARGWFHSGDLGVMYPDGYIQLKDRSKDIIISGGENISSIELEDLLYKHPAVQAASVVAKPDEKWGETPCAFIELKPGQTATAEEIIAFCRERVAHYKAPRFVVFTELPKTSTGKIQKFMLREMAKAI